MVPSNNTLYHYTSVDSLACILKSHTIRFMPLDTLDDLQEKVTADLKHIASYVYVSCWSDDPEESIPMWRMYTPDNAGVRMELPALPFKMHPNGPFVAADKSDSGGEGPSAGGNPPSLRPYISAVLEGVLTPALQTDDQSNILHQVVYTDDQALLYPTIYSQDNGQVQISLDRLGKHKNTYWSFQHEWRFVFSAIRFSILGSMQDPVRTFSLAVNEMMNGKTRQPFSHYDLELDEEAFSNMRIMLSPRLSYGNRIIVESLVEKYNPTAAVMDSRLQGLI